MMLKLQYFGHLMQRANSWEKTSCCKRLRSGGEGGDRGWLDGIVNSMDMSLSKLRDSEGQGSPVCCIHGVTNSQTWLNNNNSNIKLKIKWRPKKERSRLYSHLMPDFSGLVFHPWSLRDYKAGLSWGSGSWEGHAKRVTPLDLWCLVPCNETRMSWSRRAIGKLS